MGLSSLHVVYDNALITISAHCASVPYSTAAGTQKEPYLRSYLNRRAVNLTLLYTYSIFRENIP